jgi:hypothetical protein
MTDVRSFTRNAWTWYPGVLAPPNRDSDPEIEAIFRAEREKNGRAIMGILLAIFVAALLFGGLVLYVLGNLHGGWI